MKQIFLKIWWKRHTKLVVVHKVLELNTFKFIIVIMLKVVLSYTYHLIHVNMTEAIGKMKQAVDWSQEARPVCYKLCYFRRVTKFSDFLILTLVMINREFSNYFHPVTWIVVSLIHIGGQTHRSLESSPC